MEKQALQPIRITIKNYQSVQDLEFEINGFTCIRGGTNIGKSAIVRAISGALLNSPVVGAVRKGTRFCTVDIQAGSWGIKWEKGERDVNRYWIPGQERPLDKLGSGQADVTKELGFQTIELGDERIQPWLARQHYPLFLINHPGPTVTDFISEVSRLRVLQDSITINLRAKRRLLEEAKAKEEFLESVRDKEAQFSDLDSVTPAEEALAEQLESIEAYEERIGRLVGLQRDLERDAAVATTLGSVTKAKMPKGPPEEDAEVIRRMAIKFAELEESAKSILTIRNVTSVRMPDAPETEDGEKLLRVMKLSGLEDLKRSVDALAGVSGVVVPGDPALGEGEALVRAVRAAVRIEAFTDAVKALERGLPPIPSTDLSDKDLEKLSWAAGKMASIEDDQKAIQNLESMLEAANGKLDKVKETLDSIPKCPTCDQVTLSQHC